MPTIEGSKVVTRRLAGRIFAGAPAAVPLLAALFIILYIRSQFPTPPAQGVAFPTLVASAVLLLLYASYGLLTGEWKLSLLYRGEDGRPSTSKFQALVWTLVAVFGYCGIFALRAAATGALAPISEFPPSLMLAMGLSFTTVAVAKGITVSYVNSGRITKTGSAGETATVVQDDDGKVDLTKVQMLWWTFIAVGVYLFQLFEVFANGPGENVALPEIDQVLMVLTGLSQGVYVGKKLVSADTPTLNPISVASGPPGTPLPITGTSFGQTQGTSQVTIDGSAVAVKDWSETLITFILPAVHPTKGKWSNGQQIVIDVLIGGRSSVTPIIYTVVLPVIRSATPSPAKPQTNVTIDGTGFGTTAIAKRSVSAGGAAAAIVSWSDTQIVATLPANNASGQPWPSGTVTSAPLIVTVGDEAATLASFTVG